MKVCLVSPPTVADLDDPSVAESEIARLIAEKAPLGILSLAAVLEARGMPPTVIDLNRSYYRYLHAGDRRRRGSFCSFVADELEVLGGEVYGFSTICSSYPLTIRIVEELRRRRPGITSVLGGPQASVVDVPSLEAFPWIDFILRGEAEETLPRLIECFAGAGPVEAIPGLSLRSAGRVVRNPGAPVIVNLDALPLPAFHLYPHLKDCRYVPLELGRGCPFACTFCSTNDFFRRRFRLKSPATMLEQMRTIRLAYGIERFDLVHDMFTVDRKRVVAFCEALLGASERFEWNCSARTDCIDADLVDLMARAGCRGIFFGIETGSARMQQVIDKHLDLPDALARIARNDRLRIHTTVSLIAGFPEETPTDLAGTVSFFVESLRFDHAEPQFHLLAPLAETPLHAANRDRLVLDGIYSDVSFQGWRQDPGDRELIERWPAIFPNFHAVPTPHLDRDALKELREFLLHGARRFRWLLVALHQHGGGLLGVFDAWRAWRAGPSHQGPVVERSDHDRYYSGIGFRREFLRFVRTRVLPGVPSGRAALEVLVACEQAFDTLRSATTVNGDPAGGAPAAGGLLEPAATPRIADWTRLLEVPIDYEAIVRRLRSRASLQRIPRRRAVLAFKRQARGRIQVIKLSRCSGQLLQRCDGRRTVRDVIKEASRVTRVPGVSPHVACHFGLCRLGEDGLITTRTMTTRAGTPSTRRPVLKLPSLGLGSRQLLSRV